MTKANPHLDAALTWLEQGFCAYPTEGDGSKMPLGKWGTYQDRLPTRAEVEAWWTQDPKRGIVLICGKVSGNLEMTEVEGSHADGVSLDKLVAECDARDITWLWEKLNHEGYAEFSANGGIHTMYRVSDHPVPGNTKIAMNRNVKGEPKITYAETRGEHGYVVVAPTTYAGCSHKEDSFHAEGDSWAVFAGRIGEVPTITWADRELFHAAIKAAFDERVEPARPAPSSQPARERGIGEIRPGDDFNDRGDWTEILTSRGWTYAGMRGNQETWTRPGKNVREGHSAALGHMGSPNIYVWSGMDEERSYSKFQFVAFADYDGDFAETTKRLAAEGYGTPLETRPASMLRREDFDYSDLLGRPMTDAENGSETAQTVEAVEAPKPRPRIEDWHHIGVAEFAAKVLKDQFHEIKEEKGARSDAGWRIYHKGAWIEDDTKEIGRAMERVAKSAILQARGILAHAEEAYEADASDKNKKMIKVVEKTMTFANSCASDNGIKAITNRFSYQPGIARSIKAFDANQALLCLENGTFDLDTMSLREHSPSDLVTKRMSITFDPDAQCPLWEKSLIDWLPDPEIRAYVQRALGYTLLGNAGEGVFFVPYGGTGCGKSQFIEVMTELFGDFGMTAAAATFRDKGWEGGEATNNLHDLRGKRFVGMSETKKDRGVDEELVKRVTGGDSLTTRALYQSNIKWKPKFVLWMATNFKPALSSEDDAIWRRVKPIHFPNKFAETADEIVNLNERLIAEESAGMLNWLLEGARQYREIGLAEPGAMTAAVKEYRDENDPLEAFFAEAVEDGTVVFDGEAETETSTLYNIYSAYCARNNIRYPVNLARFSRMLNASSRGIGSRRGTNGIKIRTGVKVIWMRDANTPAHSWTQGRS